MSVCPHEILRCAAVIAEAAHGEANFRSAISRSYYAAYHAAYAWHRALPAPGGVGHRGTGRHETLVNQLYHPGLMRSHPSYWRSIALARMLNRGRLLRMQADYHVDAELDREQMMGAVVNSAMIVGQCSVQQPEEHGCVTV